MSLNYSVKYEEKLNKVTNSNTKNVFKFANDSQSYSVRQLINCENLFSKFRQGRYFKRQSTGTYTERQLTQPYTGKRLTLYNVLLHNIAKSPKLMLQRAMESLAEWSGQSRRAVIDSIDLFIARGDLVALGDSRIRADKSAKLIYTVPFGSDTQAVLDRLNTGEYALNSLSTQGFKYHFTRCMYIYVNEKRLMLCNRDKTLRKTSVPLSRTHVSARDFVPLGKVYTPAVGIGTAPEAPEIQDTLKVPEAMGRDAGERPALSSVLTLFAMHEDQDYFQRLCPLVGPEKAERVVRNRIQARSYHDPGATA